MSEERMFAVVGRSGWIVTMTLRDTEEEASEFLRRFPFNEHGYHVEPVLLRRESPSLFR